MELKKLIDECIEALQEEAGSDYSYYEDDTPFGATVNTDDGYIDLWYTDGDVEATVYHDYEGDTNHPRYGVSSVNLEKFISDALHDCVDWSVIEEEWKEWSMDEYQWHGFNSEADFWRWKEG